MNMTFGSSSEVKNVYLMSREARIKFIFIPPRDEIPDKFVDIGTDDSY